LKALKEKNIQVLKEENDRLKHTKKKEALEIEKLRNEVAFFKSKAIDLQETLDLATKRAKQYIDQ
jgi:cell division protein FtsB